MKKYLCTLFDYNYLPLGLALYQSINANFDDFHLWILCLDEKVENVLVNLALKNVTLLGLGDIEEDDLLKAKGNRTWQEYCWTLSPVLPSYVLNSNAEIDHITYIDSDIYFYTSPNPIYEEIGASSIMIIPHRFPDRLSSMEKNGIYNVQMVYFRRDSEGIACLSRWRSQCLEWCYYRLEDGKMGDQKYLDTWPSDFSNVCVLQHKGAGVALWNIEQYRVSQREGMIYIDDVPLIFYHFHQYKYFAGGLYFSKLAAYQHDTAAIPVYNTYTQTIHRLEKEKIFSGRRLSVRDKINGFRDVRVLHSAYPLVDFCWRLVAKFLSIFRVLDPLRSVPISNPER